MNGMNTIVAITINEISFHAVLLFPSFSSFLVAKPLTLFYDMLIPIFLMNQTILLDAVSRISNQLKGPTLVYYEDYGEADQIIEAFSGTRTLTVATPNNRLQPDTPQLPRSAILFGKDPGAIVSTLRGWSLWHARSQVLVILQDGGSAHDWLELLWNQTKAVEVTVMVLSNPVTYFTWYPYRKNQCTTVNTVSVKETNVFPVKLFSNFGGCPLFAASSKTTPFVVGESDGVETGILHTIAQKVNLNVKIYFNQTVWFSLNALGQPINDFALVSENKLDIIFSNFPKSWRLSCYTDALISHTQDSLMWFVPSPGLAPSAYVIFRAFSKLMWTWVIGIFLLSGAMTLFIPWIEKGSPQAILVRLIAFTLNLPMTLPKSRAFRMFGIAIYIYSLHTTTAYQSSLMAFLTTPPRDAPMSGVDDIVKTQFKVIIPTGYRSLLTTSTYPKIQALSTVGRVLWEISPNTSLIANTGEVVVLGPAISNNIKLQDPVYDDEHGFKKVLMLSDPVLMTPIMSYMSLGHPLVPVLNKYIQFLIEGGFPKHFLAQWTKAHQVVKQPLEPFDLTNLEGAFSLLLTCLLISGLSLPIEWIHWRWKNRKYIRNMEQFTSKCRLRSISCTEIAKRLPNDKGSGYHFLSVLSERRRLRSLCESATVSIGYTIEKFHEA